MSMIIMTFSYFTLLNLPASLTLEEATVRQHYFAAQRQFHPDKAKTPQERLQFLQRSADINAAYHTLKDPLARLFYVLKQQGHDILHEHPPHKAPPALLMDMMAWQEERTELESDSEKQAFNQRVDATIASLYARCVEEINADKWESAVATALHLRYMQKLKG
jgi:molecular chaperone HscB